MLGGKTMGKRKRGEMFWPKARGGVAERSGATRAKCFLARKFSIVRRARLVSAALACRRARKGPGMVGSVQLCGNFFCSCLGSSQRSPASSSPRSQQFSAGYTQQAAVPAFPEPCLGSSLLRTSSLEPGWEVRYFELPPTHPRAEVWVHRSVRFHLASV